MLTLVVVLQTGTVPSAPGSAYLELEASQQPRPNSLLPQQSTLKLSCTVHGPKPVPRSASFSPNLQLSAHIKISPFATRVRKGYVRDNEERDISVHLETALKAVVLADRYPKSAVDVVVTVLEAEEDSLVESEGQGMKGCATMNLLAGCLTVASVALVDAKIDCVDLMVGGVAMTTTDRHQLVLDPSPTEHNDIAAACVVGYLPSRDEITELWMKGDLPAKGTGTSIGVDGLIDAAVGSAKGAYAVLQQAIKEAAERDFQQASSHSIMMPVKPSSGSIDIEMKS